MGYEKKYKEALNRAVEFHSKDVIEAMEYVFQLDFRKEKRIINCLRMMLKYATKDMLDNYELTVEDCSQWLYKQLDNISYKDEENNNFKVGDWIIDKDSYTVVVDKIISGDYYLCDKHGRRSATPSEISNFRHWNLNDAKAGDILREDSCTFILKEKTEHTDEALVWCALHDDGDMEFNEKLTFDEKSTRPATPVQTVELILKLKSKGYNWNGKELVVVK